MSAFLDLSGYSFRILTVPFLATGALMLVLAAVVYSRQRGSRVGIAFSGMVFVTGLWLTGFGLMISAAIREVAMLWARIGFAGIVFMPPIVYAFTVTALRKSHQRVVWIAVVWGLGFLSLLVLMTSRGLLSGVKLHEWGYYPRLGALAVPFLIYFFGILIAHVLEYVGEYRSTEDPARRRQIRRLMFAFLLVYLASYDFVPMIGWESRPIGYLPILAFVAYAAGSIRRHRLSLITPAMAAREILDTMADALVVVDASGRIRVVNQAVCRLLGYQESELIGKPIGALESLDSADPASMGGLYRRGVVRDEERSYCTKEGRPIEVSISISPLRDRNLEGGAVVIARDIRERKRSETEIRRAMEKLERSNRNLQEFAYVASHDLQEPLRKVRAFGDLLVDRFSEDLPEQAQDYVGRMQNAAGRMQQLISDLLAFSRVSTEARPFDELDLNEIVEEVIEDLEILIDKKGARIDVESLPRIEADPAQIRQLFQNLLGNGLKFSREGVDPRIVVSSRQVVPDFEGRKGWEIQIADNGIGIEEKYRERIFTIFQRLHGRGQYEGTGIGLAICKRIVERHQGEIRVEESEEGGAKFVVTLPERMERTE